MAGKRKRRYGTSMRTVDLAGAHNWPKGRMRDDFAKDLAERVRGYPAGDQHPWGIPFRMADDGPGVILVSRDTPDVAVRLRGKATHLCVLHEWVQRAEDIRPTDPTEGLLIGEYELAYADDTRSTLPVRARFEVAMAESPGPPWRAVPFEMPRPVDPTLPPDDSLWGWAQTGFERKLRYPRGGPKPLVCVLENPHPERTLRAVTLRGLTTSPLIVSGLTLATGTDNPLHHLPRRMVRVHVPGGRTKVEAAEVDLGHVVRIEHTDGPRDRRWLESRHAPTEAPEPDRGEDLIELTGSQDATLSVQIDGRRRPLNFSVGEAMHEGRSASGNVRIETLGRERQWMQVTVIDDATGRPTPVRLHMSGARGEYLPPYGHHQQVNANWFEDYGADLRVANRNYAYVPGRFTTELPVGDVYVEMHKGFEYAPVRTKVAVRPGRKELTLRIHRWKDLRADGWVTADTHVHFLSPHTAWLEAQAEGVNVVNLLASQWGRLFTNVGDLTGKPGVVENDTIVFVGTENRNHMLGHMSMLGTRDLPVFPMCCGGPGEAWIGDPDFRLLAEWALENRRKGGVVIRPHYPYCGHTEDPVPIIKGLVDALEIRVDRNHGFPTQEWYRYLNCGYRVAACGGTDKMGAYRALGSLRTYAKLDPNRPFTYARWAEAVRKGRTTSTTGPLLDVQVDGHAIGDTIRVPAGGATFEVTASAECFVPLGRLEIVANGRVVASQTAKRGAKKITLRERVSLAGSGWISARCNGDARHPGAYMAAHTSPVYVQCGRERPFDGPAAQHMLALVEGGMEYLNTLATHYDEPSRKRMVTLFKEVRQELNGRLVVEADHHHHHGGGHYHSHGHGVEADHSH